MEVVSSEEPRVAKAQTTATFLLMDGRLATPCGRSESPLCGGMPQAGRTADFRRDAPDCRRPKAAHRGFRFWVDVHAAAKMKNARGRAATPLLAKQTISGWPESGARAPVAQALQ